MGALVQTKPSRYASFKANRIARAPSLRPRHGGFRPRAAGISRSVNAPTLPLSIRDEMLEYYAFIFCQGGFRPLDMPSNNFCSLPLQSNRPTSRRSARKRGQTELVHALPKERGARSCAMSY
jgi:hypothetical protein